MDRKTTMATPPSLYGQPQVFFRRDDFNAVIWSHSYDITCEKAIRCPCQGDGGSPHLDCHNCHGTGYFYINPYETKALITGLNRITQYVQWAPELMGTASITVRDEDKDYLSYFDRVVVKEEYATFTEMLVAREMLPSVVGVFLSYAPIEIVAVFKYDGPDKPLIKLDKTVYSLVENNPYCLVFTEGNVLEAEGVSVLYKHRVEYHVIDMPHEIRASLQANKQSGQLEVIKMPIQVIGRRTHLIDMQRPNFDGSGLIYNDYDTDSSRLVRHR